MDEAEIDEGARGILLVMARAWRDDHRRPLGELGARVDITVVPGPRAPTLRGRIAPLRKRRALACLAAVAVAAGALAVGVSVTGHGQATGLLPTTVLPNTVLHLTYLRPTGPVAAPRASAHPPRCVRLLTALQDPSLKHAAFDRNMPCGDPRGPYTLIAIGAPRSGGMRRATPGARSHRG